MYVRVKDESTGHEFDVREDSLLLRKERVKPVKAKEYPPSRVARLPKHHIKLAGRTASRETGTASVVSDPPAAPAVADEAPEEEN
jgi:hypothetical protein